MCLSGSTLVRMSVDWSAAVLSCVLSVILQTPHLQYLSTDQNLITHVTTPSSISLQ
jgi:hypothetical protein